MAPVDRAQDAVVAAGKEQEEHTVPARSWCTPDRENEQLQEDDFYSSTASGSSVAGRVRHSRPALLAYMPAQVDPPVHVVEPFGNLIEHALDG